DYFGDYAINLDGSVLLKSGAIPYRIEAYKVPDGPNPTGHAVWWYLDYGGWGITTFCFAPGTGGCDGSQQPRRLHADARLKENSRFGMCGLPHALPGKRWSRVSGRAQKRQSSDGGVLLRALLSRRDAHQADVEGVMKVPSRCGHCGS